MLAFVWLVYQFFVRVLPFFKEGRMCASYMYVVQGMFTHDKLK